MADEQDASPPMTIEEFEVVQRKLLMMNFSGKVIEAARLIMVTGATRSQVAYELKMSRQSVYQGMIRVRAVLADIPADWVPFEGWMPKDMAAEIRQRISHLKTNKK